MLKTLVSCPAQTRLVRVVPPWVRPFVSAKNRRIFDHVVVLDFNDGCIPDALIRKISCCRAIRELYLSGNDLTDETLAHLAELECLEVLALNYTEITDAGLAHLADNWCLRSLELGDTKVTAAGIVSLSSLPTLEELTLGGTSLDDAGLKRIVSKAKSLRGLDLEDTNVGDAGVACLKDLPCLEVLILDFTDVTDASIPYLVQLGSLDTLHISGARITKGGCDELKKKLQGVQIWHSERENPLDGKD